LSQAPESLDVSYFGEQLKVRPYAVQGVGLLCSGPLKSIMVMEYQAHHRMAYWNAWVALGGERQGLVWEDGSAFKCPLTVASGVEYGTLRHPAASGGVLRRVAACVGVWLRRAAAAFRAWLARLWELPAED
jgi:hypothetical protein